MREKIANEIAQQANERGIPIMSGSVVLDTTGNKTLTGISVAKLPDEGQSGITTSGIFACQGLAISGGLNPVNDLYSQAGGKLRYDAGLACFVPDEGRQCVTVAGAARGKFSLADALTNGAQAGS